MPRSWHRPSRHRIAILLLGTCCAPALLAEEDTPAAPQVILQNERIRVRILPQSGAGLDSFVLKPSGKEFAGKLTLTEGLVLPGGEPVLLADRPFALVGEPSPSLCTLWTMLPENSQRKRNTRLDQSYLYYPQDDLAAVRLDKTYELKEGAEGLQVTYRYRNTGQAPVSLCPSYIRHFLAGDKSARLAVASRDGALPIRSDHPLYAYYFPDGRAGVAFTGTQAWIAVSPPDGRPSLINVFNPRHTSALRVVLGVPECIGTRVRIDPGEVFTTSTWVMPLGVPPDLLGGAAEGMGGTIQFGPPSTLSAAEILEGRLESPEKIFESTPGEDAAGTEEEGIEAMEKVLPKELAVPKGYLKQKRIPATLAFGSAIARTVRVESSARVLPGGAPIALGREEVRLTPGSLSQVSVNFVPETVGTWVISFAVYDGETLLATVEKPVDVQGPSGFFLSPHHKDRVGEVFTDWGKFDPFDIRRPPSLDIEVPHVKHARPYARGKVRATIVVPWQIGREAVELAQRVDLDLSCVFVGAHGFIWEQKLVQRKSYRTPLDELHTMRDALNRNPQVIIVIGTPLRWFDPETQNEIVRQVRAGAGLVLCPAQEVPEPIANLVKAAKESYPFPGADCPTAILGRGRICFMDAPGLGVAYRPQMAVSEARLEQSIRAALWAAQMEPEIEMAVQPARLQIDHGSADRAVLDVAIKNPTKNPFSGVLHTVARQDRVQDFGTVYGSSYCLGVMVSMPYALFEDVASTKAPLELPPGGEIRRTVELPKLRAGTYRVYTILKDPAGAVVNWTYVPTKVTASYAITKLTVEKKPCDEKRLFGYRPEDTVRVRFHVQAKNEPEQGIVAFLKGVDREDRVIFSQVAPLDFQEGAAEARLESPLHGAYHRLLILRTGIEARGQALLEERRPLLVRESPGRRPKFRFILLDNESSLPLHLTGINEQMGPYSAVVFAWYDMLVWPTGTFLQEGSSEERDQEARAAVAAAVAKEADGAMPNLEPAKPQEAEEAAPIAIDEEDTGKKSQADRGFVRSPCFNDPAYRATKIKTLRDFVSDPYLLGPQYLYFTHEYSYGSHDVCQCPQCQAAFRKRMETAYGTLDHLNTIWGTTYRTWEDVRLYRVDKGLSPPPEKAWPQVIDTFQYKSSQLVDLAQEIVRTGKGLSDDIEYGHIALSKMSLWVGMDFWEWSRVGDRHIMYRDLEEWQSCCGTRSTQGWHSGYGRQYSPGESQGKLWWTLFTGTWGIAHFTSPAYPLSRPDGTFFEGPQALFDNLKEIQRGWDELLLGYDWKDGVGLYRSTPSFWVHMMEFWQARGGNSVKPDNSGDMDWERRISHYLRGMAGSHRQAHANYVYHGQVMDGHLGLFGTPKVLFLCYAPAMSRKEADVLRQFVQEGGVLVGDVNPAVRDEHGKLWEKPLLDELFGIERDGGYQPARGILPGEGPVRVEFSEPVAEVKELNPLVVGPANIRLSGGAKSLASFEIQGTRVPAYVVRSYGKGKTVYLNFLVLHMNQNTGQTWDVETEKASNALVCQLIVDAGVQPFAWMEQEPGSPLPCAVGRFRDGDNWYLGVLAPWGHSPAAYETCRARLSLLEARHVYDARRGEYLGHGKEFALRFTPEMLASVSAVLPYRVQGLAVSADSAAVDQGNTLQCRVEVRTDGPKPGRHVIRVDALGPDGVVSGVHSQNLTMEKGEGAIVFRTARNEPVGRWRLVLRDMATGTRAERPVEVTERKD